MRTYRFSRVFAAVRRYSKRWGKWAAYICGNQNNNNMNIEEFKADLLRRFPFKPGYKFMAVDSDGWCDQYTNKPKVRAVTWGNNSGACSYVGWVELPDGVDWRETLVSRAETNQPTPPAQPTFEQRHDALMAKLDELIGVMRAVVEAVHPVNDYKGANEQR